jgi:hypothetical protein
MRHLEDKQLCPHCGGELHRQPYMMSRRATELVLPIRLIAWIVTYAVVLTFLSLHS